MVNGIGRLKWSIWYRRRITGQIGSGKTKGLFSHTQVCLSTCVCVPDVYVSVCIHVSVCVCVYVYVSVCFCMSVSTYLCLHVWQEQECRRLQGKGSWDIAKKRRSTFA